MKTTRFIPLAALFAAALSFGTVQAQGMKDLDLSW